MPRRMTLIVLALLGLMVLVVTVSPPDRGGSDDGDRATQPARTAPATASPLTDPDAYDVAETLSAAEDGQTVAAEVGDRVAITVQGTEGDSVALGDLDVEVLDAGYPARFELLADTPGRYPLVRLSDDRRIGMLQIR
jgi:hypothetical protein